MAKNRALSFVVLVYVITGLYSLLYLKFPYSMQGPGMFITPFYMFMPLIAALILQKLVYREPLRDIGFTFTWSPWYFYAALLPFAAAALAFGISLLMPGVSFDPDMAGFLDRISKTVPPEQFAKAKEQLMPMKDYMIYVTALQALVAGCTINALFAFGEEAGWRGFLLNALKGRHFYFTAAVTGSVWGFWHAPVIIQGHNYPQHPVLGIFLMAAWCMMLAPLIAYAAVRTRSILGAAIMHGTINASAGMPLMYIKGGDDLTVGLTGLAGFIALAVLNVGLFVYDRYFARERTIV